MADVVKPDLDAQCVTNAGEPSRPRVRSPRARPIDRGREDERFVWISDACVARTVDEACALLADEIHRRGRQRDGSYGVLVLRIVLLDQRRRPLAPPPLAGPDVVRVDTA